MAEDYANRQVSAASRELLRGAYDIHVHANPSLGPDCRGFAPDDFQVIAQAREAGLCGVCIKNLEFATVFRDYLVNKIEAEQGFGSCRYYSSLSLNLTVGGINPYAVDFAALHGAKCVWFPTYSSQYMAEQFGWGAFDGYSPDSWLTYTKMRHPQNGRGLSILDDSGQLLPEVWEIIEITKTARMAIATGHMSPQESFALCRAAREMGHEKVILTHSDLAKTWMNQEMVFALAKLGVFIEKTFCAHVLNHDPERAYGFVRQLGAECFILTSDTGQPQMPPPVMALGLLADDYLAQGFGAGEIQTMLRDNPHFLMNG